MYSHVQCLLPSDPSKALSNEYIHIFSEITWSRTAVVIIEMLYKLLFKHTDSNLLKYLQIIYWFKSSLVDALKDIVESSIIRLWSFESA